jgi:hypothetical protein
MSVLHSGASEVIEMKQRPLTSWTAFLGSLTWRRVTLRTCNHVATRYTALADRSFDWFVRSLAFTLLATSHMTPSVHGGVVKEPLYL